MANTKPIQYEFECFFPNVDRQKLWDLFVDHEAWSKSDLLPGEITVLKPGKDHPQGEGATRSVSAGSMNIKEDIVGFRSPEYFSYATHNGSLPVDNFVGEMHFEEQQGGLRAQYKGRFNPKYFGTGWIFKIFLRSAQKSACQNLAKAYEAYYQ